MFDFTKGNKKDENQLEFTFKPRPINQKGNETIDDMSLIQGIYKGYIVTRTGYLVAIIEMSGINLELLNNQEQTYAFETFNTFLMNTLGDSSNEQQQYFDMTMPVKFEDYILSYKKRYLQEKNPERKKLIASYIDDFNDKTVNNTMSTKRHFLVIKEKITDKTLENLEAKVQDTNEKVSNYINRLQDNFEQYDLQAKKLYPDEIIEVLKNQFNYNDE